MLGNNHALRTSVFTFLMNNFDHPDSQICSLCQYLSVVLCGQAICVYSLL
jgi:hypothetical protein